MVCRDGLAQKQAVFLLLTTSSVRPGQSDPIELTAQALARSAYSADHPDARGDLANDRRRGLVDVARSGGWRSDALFDRTSVLEYPLAVDDQRGNGVAGPYLR